MIHEWISAIASCIAALSILFLAVQLKIAADQLRHSQKALEADHERSRREHAIEVLDRWTSSLEKSLPAARAFVQELSKEQCRSLIKREPFEAPERHRMILGHALHDVLESEHELECVNGQIRLNQKHISHLLALVIQHLNTLEVALLSWMNGVADREIIETQFQYLVRFDDGHYVLENLREVMAGKASYPAIEAFVNHLIDKHKDAQPTAKSSIA